MLAAETLDDAVLVGLALMVTIAVTTAAAAVLAGDVTLTFADATVPARVRADQEDR